MSSLLEKLDERNQAVVDYLMDHPEAGLTLNTFGKSDTARILTGAVLLATAFTAAAVGLVPGLVVALVGRLALWPFEYHPFLRGYKRHVDAAHSRAQHPARVLS
jgi:hypothetical protein